MTIIYQINVHVSFHIYFISSPKYHISYYIINYHYITKICKFFYEKLIKILKSHNCYKKDPINSTENWKTKIT